MKLYIPTCTLNFNNIFSTESISPAIHYTKRGFGNKRYYKVEANNLDNVVLLYSKYPHYYVDNRELENSALVIEIESEDYPTEKFSLVNEKDGVEVYASSSTIYFNPFRCSIYFDSYQNETSVMTKAEQSLENKYSKLYRRNFRIRQEKSWSFADLFHSKDYFEWKEAFIGNAIEIEPSDINEDILIDRLKGCFFCYLLGANMSVSKDVSRLKLLARKMKNTLSAIVNSPNKRPTDLQDETLLSYIREFNAIYTRVDDNSIYNREIISKRLVSPTTNLDRETLIKVLRDLRLEDVFYRSLNLRSVYDANDLYNCLYSTSISSAEAYAFEIKKMFDAIRRIEILEQTNSPKKIIKELLAVENKNIKVIDQIAGKGVFYPALLNSQIAGDFKKFMKENGTEESLSIAFVGGAKLKEFMPDTWENSDFQRYINGLLMNMQKGEGFDIFSIDNEIMQSFAAFCQKGEEIERLTDYMLQCGFSEYRFALGIYGATRGFAALPKTFTDGLINAPLDYYIDFYNYLYKEIFGSELKDTVIQNATEFHHVDSMSTAIPSTIMGSIDKIEPKKAKQEKVVKAILGTTALEDAVQSPKAFMYILDSFPNMTRTKAYKNLMEANFANDQSTYSIEEFKKKIYDIVGKAALKGQQDKIDTAIELEAKRQDSEAFLYILDNFLDKSSNAYKKIAALIMTTGVSASKLSTQTPVTENRLTLPISKEQRNLRPINATSANFVDDFNASNFILSRSYLPNKVRDVLAKKIISFQDDYKPGGYYYGREDSPRTNNNTIKHFINKCTFTKGNNPSWIPSSGENKALLERLKQDLYDRYANR